MKKSVNTFSLKKMGSENAVNAAIKYLGSSDGRIALRQSTGSGTYNSFVVDVKDGNVTYRKRFEREITSANNLLRGIILGAAGLGYVDVEAHYLAKDGTKYHYKTLSDQRPIDTQWITSTHKKVSNSAEIFPCGVLVVTKK